MKKDVEMVKEIAASFFRIKGLFYVPTARLWTKQTRPAVLHNFVYDLFNDAEII
jgi:hypothetical protein